jgi:hypothetical protein
LTILGRWVTEAKLTKRTQGPPKNYVDIVQNVS